MEQPNLKLVETKTLYRHLKSGIPWLDLLVLGVLVWLDERLIQLRTDQAIENALEEYEKVDPPEVELPSPVYTEQESTVEGLPEMRLQAPWRRD